MTQRAARYLFEPTKALRFVWASLWLRHRRHRLAGPLSRLAVCAAEPRPHRTPAASNVSHITPRPSVYL